VRLRRGEGSAGRRLGFTLFQATRSRGDDAAVPHVRGLLSMYPPSSPSVAIFKDGMPVYMMHRSEIEPRTAEQIAAVLEYAFEQHC